MTIVEAPTKYAGARWLQSHQDFSVSRFGVKVANVLGQSFLGIYHIDDAVLSKKVLWGSFVVICVTIHGQISTYDFDVLSRLVFCCQKAGIGVSLHGSFKGYTKLVFSPERPTLEALMDTTIAELSTRTEPPKGDFAEFASRFSHVRDGGHSLWEDNKSQAYSVEPIEWLNLQDLVYQCHQYCIRCSLVGRSNYSLEAHFSQRVNAEGGSVYDRHPTLEQHKKDLSGLINVDYTSLS